MFSWLTSWFRSAGQSPGQAQAHITFGQSAVGRSISQTRLFLKKQLWIWPIIAVLLLAVIGYGIRAAIERTMKENLRSQLQTLLSVEQSMLETWLRVQEANAESLANDQQIRALAAEILAVSQPPIGDEAAAATISPAARPNIAALNARLAHELGPGMTSHRFVSFFLADKQKTILSASHIELVGQTIPQYERFLSRALDGHTAVSPPFPSVVLMKDETGRTRTGVPTMFVSAPIRDASFQVVAVLALRIRPEMEFTRILQLGRIGQSGETYAFDKKGLMVSNSRFDDQLILLGLLPDVEDSHSILNISLRDPGGNMQQGFRPAVRRAELPLVKAAEEAISGKSGVDVEGYRGYRGALKVGAYGWLSDYDLGLITDIDYAEAFRPLTILQWAFFSMFGLLILSSIAIFAFTLVVARLQREAQKAAIEAKQLGQYRLETRLGAGAMGVVYKGHHAMLRRPTAIKMLNVERVNDASIQRFEREVQITCQLNNPNTIAIYDYGRTPEGRVIQILQQVCGSLYEAHSLGLVHRDIKPANVMVNRRGGEPDVVKVLDFGLVKALDDAKQARQTGGLAGTPLYMSPESIQTPDLVDPRSDIYAVGAVGYFLLTGHPVFSATTLVELCQQHITAVPQTPSERLGRAVSTELECCLLACLEKSRAKRPQTARDLSLLLARAPTAKSWTIDDAEAWWGRHERATTSAPTATIAPASSQPSSDQTSPASAATSTSGFDRTLDH